MQNVLDVYKTHYTNAFMVGTGTHRSDPPLQGRRAPAVSALGRQPLAVQSFGWGELLAGSTPLEWGYKAPEIRTRCGATLTGGFGFWAPGGVG